MRVSAIILAGAAVAVAQDIPSLPSLPADLNPAAASSYLAYAETAIPSFSDLLASASALESSLLGGKPLPTDAAGANSLIASLNNFASTAVPGLTIPTIGGTAARPTGASTPAITGAAAGGAAQSSSTGGAAPVQTGLSMMIAGGVAAGIAAVAL